MTSDDLVVHVQNGRQGSVCCSRLCCSLLVLHEVNGTLCCLQYMEMVLPILGGCEVKLIFVKICDIFSRKFCSKMYELLLFYVKRKWSVIRRHLFRIMFTNLYGAFLSLLYFL